MIGIMDIGSNSIRVAIYEVTTSGEYRLIHENKESARLSQKIKEDGRLEQEDISSIVPILQQFHDICKRYNCKEIRVAATAAIRNAANSQEILDTVLQQSGLQIQVLSGEQEAYYGFLGVAEGIEIEDGYIIDIGGGSTEVTLFRNRELIKSVSLPIGAVNMQSKHGTGIDPWTESSTATLKKEILEMLSQHEWIKQSPGLALIGLGGTIRALGKLDQCRVSYPLNIAHHYRIEKESIHYFAQLLPSLPLAKRKRLDGLSKSRSDIIVPGVIILNTILEYTQASYIVVSGTGLREGLLLESMGLGVPAVSEVIPRQVHSILAFHSTTQLAHLQQVNKFSECLLDQLAKYAEQEPQASKLLYVAAMLYKVGGSIRYHQYDKHTLYWLTNAPIAGLNHRDALLCAYITSVALGKGKTLASLPTYRGLLEPGDTDLIVQLGTLLQIAIALDSSQTQAVKELQVDIVGDTVQLQVSSSNRTPLETRGLEGAGRSFKKAWKLNLEWEINNSLHGELKFPSSNI